MATCTREGFHPFQLPTSRVSNKTTEFRETPNKEPEPKTFSASTKVLRIPLPRLLYHLWWAAAGALRPWVGAGSRSRAGTRNGVGAEFSVGIRRVIRAGYQTSVRSGVGIRVGGHCWARIPGRHTKQAPGPIPAPPPTKGLGTFPERARRLPRPEARGSSLTCGRRSRMPAAWMSSQPTTRRSVSVSVSRPLDMDGVKRSLSSGRRQFSNVMSTPEYSRSPINTPCDAGAVPPEPGVPAGTAGAVDPGAPAPAAAAILCRRLSLAPSRQGGSSRRSTTATAPPRRVPLVRLARGSGFPCPDWL